MRSLSGGSANGRRPWMRIFRHIWIVMSSMSPSTVGILAVIWSRMRMTARSSSKTWRYCPHDAVQVSDMHFAAAPKVRGDVEPLPVVRLYTHVKMTENMAYYARLGYTESYRVTEDGFERVYMEKRLIS